VIQLLCYWVKTARKVW